MAVSAQKKDGENARRMGFKGDEIKAVGRIGKVSNCVWMFVRFPGLCEFQRCFNACLQEIEAIEVMQSMTTWEKLLP